MHGWGTSLMMGLIAASALATAAPSARWRARAATLAAFCGLTALSIVEAAFLAEVWQFEVVTDHTRPGLAWPLRAAALWAGPEGSLLLFTVLLASLTAVLARLVLPNEHDQSVAWFPRLLAALGAGWGLVVLVAASPFRLLDDPPAGGLGMQPVLEHAALTWHPPILYLGLLTALAAGASALPAPFAAGAIASRLTRPMALVALGLLSVGLATGARWAHVELGWGGYWAWDPVENAGLVAWIAVASLVHRPAGDTRVTSVAGAATALAVVWGTTITRTGVIESVHAFADRAPLRIGLIIVATVFSAVVAWSLRPAKKPSTWLGTALRHQRPGGRLIGAGAFLLAAVVVAAGTYEPAIRAAIGGEAVMIAGRYYTLALWPIIVAAGLACIIVDRAPIAAGIGAVAGVLIATGAAGFFGLMVAGVGGGIAGSALGGARKRGRLAHIGFGVVLIGIASTFAASRDTVQVAVDETVTVGSARLTHRAVTLMPDGPQARAIAAVELDGTLLNPELVNHRLRSTATSEMAELHRLGSLASTTQVVFVDGDAERATYQVYTQPRIGLVWLGAGLTAFGAIAALGYDRRRRLPARS